MEQFHYPMQLSAGGKHSRYETDNKNIEIIFKYTCTHDLSKWSWWLLQNSRKEHLSIVFVQLWDNYPFMLLVPQHPKGIQIIIQIFLQTEEAINPQQTSWPQNPVPIIQHKFQKHKINPPIKKSCCVDQI